MFTPLSPKRFARAIRRGTAVLFAVVTLGATAWAGATTTTLKTVAPTPQPIKLQPSAATEPAGLPEIAPPLSIYDSCQLLGVAARALADHSTSPSQALLGRVDRMLHAVMVYVERVDRANPTLPYYAWQDVSAEKVPKDGWGTQTFPMAVPIPQVTALSIRARHGDVEIRQVVAVDSNGTRWEFNQNITALADQPRPEICFLPLPTQLAEVRVTCRRTNPRQRWARLFIAAGISSMPESAKSASHHLQRARLALDPPRTDEALKHIRQAWEQLREYQKTRRF